MADKSTITTKLGTTRAGECTRIWLEGARLLAHGFTKGTLCKRAWNADAHKLVLTIVDAATFAELPRDARTTVAGTEARPIIDIASARVRSVFRGTHVEAEYSRGRIVVTEGAGS